MEHLIPWLSLKNVAGIGNLLYKRLVDHFSSPAAVLAASLHDLMSIEGVGRELAGAIKAQKTPDWIRGELKMAASKGFRIITQRDADFPKLLLEIADPPPLLYVYGCLKGIEPAVAVVGSRKATSYGLTTTRRLCKGLASQGITVVSGMARGIDTAAHEGALATGGKTIAVLGTGLNHIYPAENRQLFHRIAENGAVVTEFALNAKPEAHHFPIRNRIISGISLGTVVVEAAQRSGSLITARLAAEQNREVFAVPGNVHAPTTQGTHALIKQGAKLVQDIADILEELQAHLRPSRKANQAPQTGAKLQSISLSEDEARVLEAVGPYPVHMEALAARAQMDIGPLTALLIQLELRGVIHQEPGNYYIRHMDYIEE